MTVSHSCTTFFFCRSVATIGDIVAPWHSESRLILTSSIPLSRPAPSADFSGAVAGALSPLQGEGRRREVIFRTDARAGLASGDIVALLTPDEGHPYAVLRSEAGADTRSLPSST